MWFKWTIQVHIKFGRLLSQGTLKLRWIRVSFKQGNTREKVGLFCDQYRFRDDDTINYATGGGLAQLFDSVPYGH